MINNKQEEQGWLLEQRKCPVGYCKAGYMSLNLLKPIACKTTRVNPNVNYGLWTTMMSQCRFLILTNVLLWWGEVLKRAKATYICGSGYMGNLCTS